MVVLNTFLLKFSTLLWREFVSFALGLCAVRPPLVIFQKRLTVMRAPAVRPPGQFHLQHSKIDPKLQFLAPIEASNFSHLNTAILVRPILQDSIPRQTHLV